MYKFLQPNENESANRVLNRSPLTYFIFTKSFLKLYKSCLSYHIFHKHKNSHSLIIIIIFINNIKSANMSAGYSQFSKVFFYFTSSVFTFKQAFRFTTKSRQVSLESSITLQVANNVSNLSPDVWSSS